MIIKNFASTDAFLQGQKISAILEASKQRHPGSNAHIFKGVLHTSRTWVSFVWQPGETALWKQRATLKSNSED